MWLLRLHAILGSLVVTIGFWLTWGTLTTPVLMALSLGIVAFLLWRAPSLPAIWAWTTLLLGIESLTWPILTMLRVRMESTEPTDQQMGDILTSVLFGFFSAIFWLTFAYGIFKKIYPPNAPLDSPVNGSTAKEGPKTNKKKKKRKR